MYKGLDIKRLSYTPALLWAMIHCTPLESPSVLAARDKTKLNLNSGIIQILNQGSPVTKSTLLFWYLLARLQILASMLSKGSGRRAEVKGWPQFLAWLYSSNKTDKLQLTSESDVIMWSAKVGVSVCCTPIRETGTIVYHNITSNTIVSWAWGAVWAKLQELLEEI